MAATPASRSGGQILVDQLVRHGVETVFAVPGESYLEVLDALFDAPIRTITCRHESGAAFMAEAYGKLTGRLGVVCATRGPGACNASIGVHTAFQDSTPMLLLLGDVARAQRGREAFQEVDFERMFAPLAKAVERIDSAERIPEVMARAIHTALSGRPGPVVLALPEDMLRDQAAVLDIPPAPLARPHPGPKHMAELSRLLSAAQRPLAIAGGGGWADGGRTALAAFASAFMLPVACSFRRSDLFNNRHVCYAGELALGANPSLIQRIKDSDLLIVIGARLGETTSQGYTLLDLPTPKQSLVHVHPSAEELGRVFRPTLAIQSGLPAFAAAAAGLPKLETIPWRDWTQAAHADWQAWGAPRATGGLFDSGEAMRLLNDKLPEEAIIAVDAGNFAIWVQRFLAYGNGRRLLGPTNGAMGYGVPAALAAKLAAPQRLSVACVGDGGALMTGQEIATALQHDAPILILVFDNGMYGTIRMHQERRHPGRTVGTQLDNPDFAAWARSFGAHGETVKSSAEFAPALDRALAAVSGEKARSALLHLRTDPEISTPKATLTQLRGGA